MTGIGHSHADVPTPPGSAFLLPDIQGFAAVAAESGHPVLLHGETGCGKTHLARLIHASGSRARCPFVRVNCAAIPETLFEREMFGHVRGAFTDAREAGPGFLEAADGGVLFLDEVSEMPPALQPKLLAVLDDGCFRRLGSTRESRVDVQVIAATNRDLGEMVRLRQFREDLFYRLSVLRYEVPPLRKRRREIPALVCELLARIGRAGHPPATVSEAALAVLVRQAWPGNIRELENALRTASAFARGGPIFPEHLPAEVRGVPGRGEDGTPAAAERYTAPADADEEVRRIHQALRAVGGNKSLAARQLGMSRTTLWAKLQRYGREIALQDEPAPPAALLTLLLSLSL